MVEYLLPLKSTATTQWEHVFFDIDVKGGEKEWFRPNAIVGGPNRLAHSFRVAINAKGGYSWHVYKKSVLVIDGKNKRRSRRREISGGSATVVIGSSIQRTINRILDNIGSL